MVLIFLRTTSTDTSEDATEKDRDLKPSTKLTGYRSYVARVAYNPHGRPGATASWDNGVWLWDRKMREFVTTSREAVDGYVEHE